MARPQELQNFVNKFLNLWKTGQNARLAVNCQGGIATVNLQLQLGGDNLANPHKPGPSPSRQRRSARRALARAEAAANAAAAAPPLAKTDAAVQAVPTPISTNDVAVEAKVATTTKDAVVQTDTSPPFQKVLAVQASPQPHRYVPAGQAAAVRHHGDPRHVRDVFCPDRDYQIAGRAVYRIDEEMSDYEQNRANAKKTLQMIDQALNYRR